MGNEAELRRSVADLRAKLNELNNEKEAFFKQKRELSAKIGSFAREIKSAREERDSLTGNVKSSKGSRTELNQQIKDKIAVVKELQDKKDELRKKFSIKGDPMRLRKQIERINTRIETEALSFKKEKELMKTVKTLKKEYDSSKELVGVLNQIAVLSKEIDDLKKQANSEHKQIQEQATQSQEKHLKMIDSAKSLEALRKEDAAIEANIQEKKAAIKELSNQLSVKLKELGDLTGEVQEMAHERRKHREANLKKKLNERKAEVSEKLKKGLTLTTEDLLVLQEGEEVE